MQMLGSTLLHTANADSCSSSTKRSGKIQEYSFQLLHLIAAIMRWILSCCLVAEYLEQIPGEVCLCQSQGAATSANLDSFCSCCGCVHGTRLA
jgi:hypothetical protein